MFSVSGSNTHSIEGEFSPDLSSSSNLLPPGLFSIGSAPSPSGLFMPPPTPNYYSSWSHDFMQISIASLGLSGVIKNQHVQLLHKNWKELEWQTTQARDLSQILYQENIKLKLKTIQLKFSSGQRIYAKLSNLYPLSISTRTV